MISRVASAARRGLALEIRVRTSYNKINTTTTRGIVRYFLRTRRKRRDRHSSAAAAAAARQMKNWNVKRAI